MRGLIRSFPRKGQPASGRPRGLRESESQVVSILMATAHSLQETLPQDLHGHGRQKDGLPNTLISQALELLNMLLMAHVYIYPTGGPFCGEITLFDPH